MTERRKWNDLEGVELSPRARYIATEQCGEQWVFANRPTINPAAKPGVGGLNGLRVGYLGRVDLGDTDWCETLIDLGAEAGDEQAQDEEVYCTTTTETVIHRASKGDLDEDPFRVTVGLTAFPEGPVLTIRTGSQTVYIRPSQLKPVIAAMDLLASQIKGVGNE